MINFKNKNILITGASGGIGNELVKKFVSLGGNVLGSGTKTEKLDLLKKKYPNIKVKKFNMEEHSRVEEFIDNVSLELGGLDILISHMYHIMCAVVNLVSVARSPDTCKDKYEIRQEQLQPHQLPGWEWIL